MTTESVASESTQATAGPNGLRKIFTGPNGIRAGWRMAVFLLFFVALGFLVVQRGLRLIPGAVRIIKLAQSGGVLTPQFDFIFEGPVLIVALVAAGIMSRIERQPFAVYGMPLREAFGRLFWQGVVWGLAFETIVMLAIWLLRGFSFGTLALSGREVAPNALLWAIGMVLVGMFEEFFFRGYAQFTLASGVGFWPAAILLSIVFGAVHLSNPGEGWVGALSVFIFGIFSCFTLWRTGNLWFAIGLHAAANFAETFIFSVPDSGMLATGHLLNSNIHGQRWLTGGTIGPEGSVISFALFVIYFLAFHWVYAGKKNKPSSETPQYSSLRSLS